MKTYIFASLFSLLFFASCGDAPNEKFLDDISGTWRYTKYEYSRTGGGKDSVNVLDKNMGFFFFEDYRIT